MVRRIAIVYLFLAAAGTASWWVLLIAVPSTRAPFLPPGAPDAVLLAFLPGDILLFAGAAGVAATGLVLDRRWAWPVLLVHAGAALYAALYCLTLTLVTGDAWPGAALMAPPILILPPLIFGLRPRGHSG